MSPCTQINTVSKTCSMPIWDTFHPPYFYFYFIFISPFFLLKEPGEQQLLKFSKLVLKRLWANWSHIKVSSALNKELDLMTSRDPFRPVILLFLPTSRIHFLLYEMVQVTLLHGSTWNNRITCQPSPSVFSLSNWFSFVNMNTGIVVLQQRKLSKWFRC